jgi:hypothetical protein
MAAGDSGVFVATRQHLDIVEQRLEVSSLDFECAACARALRNA